MCLTGTRQDQCVQSPVDLGQFQNMTDFALAAKAQFRLECSIAGTRKVEGKFKVQGYSSNIPLVFAPNEDRR